MMIAHTRMPVLCCMLALSATACNDPQAAADCSASGLEAAPTSTGDWRQTVDSILAEAPPDSMVVAALGDLRAPLPDVREQVEAAGGEVIHVFRTIPAVTVRVPANGLRDLIDAGFAGYVSIGRPGGGPLDCAGAGS